LTLEAKAAIRKYMISLVTVPVIVAGLFGYFWLEVRDVSHYLINRINQRVAIACGDDFASSYGIADA